MKKRQMRTPEPKPVFDPETPRPPRNGFRSELSNGPELALTKEDHDRLVAGKGRPITQDPIGYYRRKPHSSVPDESATVRRSES